MDENGPIACVPLYADASSGDQTPLSADLGGQDMTVGLPPRELYPQVAREMTMVDNKLSVVRISNKNDDILKNLNYRMQNPNSQLYVIPSHSPSPSLSQ